MLHKSTGFTLIEILIAIIIFVLISLASYKMLTSVTNIKTVIDQEFQQLNYNINAEIIMEQDFLQAVGGIALRKDNSNDVFASPSNDGYNIKFLRQGWQSTLQEPRSDLLIVAYSVVDKNLIRYSWAFDKNLQMQNPTLKQQILWKGITTFKLRFLDGNNKWHNQWPVKPTETKNLNSTSNNKSNKQNKSQELIPCAVEIRLVTEELGSNIIVLPLPTNLTSDDIKSLSTMDAQLDNLKDVFMQGLKDGFK